MNDIAHSLGSFFGGLVFCALNWQLGAWITRAVTKRPDLATFIGALMALIYATTRGDTAGAWGAWLAFAFMLSKQ